MRYLPPGSMRRQRWVGRLEGSAATLAVVFFLGFGLIAAAPIELYQSAVATYHPTPEGKSTRIQHVQMPPCGPGKDCTNVEPDGTVTLLPRFDTLPSPNVQYNTNQVPEPGTLALIGAGIALMMMRKVKRVTW